MMMDVVVIEFYLFEGFVDVVLYFVGSKVYVVYGWMLDSGFGVFVLGESEVDDFGGFDVVDLIGMLLIVLLFLGEGLKCCLVLWMFECVVGMVVGCNGFVLW